MEIFLNKESLVGCQGIDTSHRGVTETSPSYLFVCCSSDPVNLMTRLFPRKRKQTARKVTAKRSSGRGNLAGSNRNRALTVQLIIAHATYLGLIMAARNRFFTQSAVEQEHQRSSPH